MRCSWFVLLESLTECQRLDISFRPKNKDLVNITEQELLLQHTVSDVSAVMYSIFFRAIDSFKIFARCLAMLSDFSLLAMTASFSLVFEIADSF